MESTHTQKKNWAKSRDPPTAPSIPFFLFNILQGVGTFVTIQKATLIHSNETSMIPLPAECGRIQWSTSEKQCGGSHGMWPRKTSQLLTFSHSRITRSGGSRLPHHKTCVQHSMERPTWGGNQASCQQPRNCTTWESDPPAPAQSSDGSAGKHFNSNLFFKNQATPLT